MPQAPDAPWLDSARFEAPSAAALDRRSVRGCVELATALGVCFFTCTSVWAAPPREVGPEVDAALDRALQLSDAFATLLERISPAVVLIAIETKRELPPVFRVPSTPADHARSQVEPAGTGVVFRADGHILTSHRLIEHAIRIEVTLKDGRSFPAHVVGHDPTVDLAVLKIAASQLPVAAFGDSNKLRVGEWVLAIGAPFGIDHTLSAGVLNARGRGLGVNEIEDYLQTDARIHGGNAGGPLIDLHGRVIGINTLALGVPGIGFAIPGNLARSTGEQLVAAHRVSRPWVGVSFQELTPDLAQRLGKLDVRGALVASVVAHGPADRAGIRPGDVIEKIGDDDVGHCKDLLHAVLARPVGSEAQLTLRRDGAAREVRLEISERPNDPALEAPLLGAAGAAPPTAASGATSAELGLDLQPITPEIARELDYRGSGTVAVVSVRPGSQAEVSGIQRGDVIVEAERQAVRRPDDIADAARDGKVMLRVDRKSGSFFTVLCRR